MTRVRAAGWMLLLYAACPGLHAASDTHAPMVGLEGRLDAVLPEPALWVRTPEKRSDPAVRIVSRQPVDEGYRYTFTFVAPHTGAFDLGAHLEDAGGASLAGREGLSVRIGGLLDEDHDGSLGALAPPEMPALGGYRTAMLAVLGFWALSWPVIWWLRRCRRAPPAPAAKAPSLEEQLRGLCERACAGTLDAAGQARLERLAMAYWRERLELGSLDALDLVRALKDHANVGATWRELEDWLHRPSHATPRVPQLFASFGAQPTTATAQEGPR